MKSSTFFRCMLPVLVILNCIPAIAQNTFYFSDEVIATGFRQAGELKADLSVKPQVKNDDGLLNTPPFPTSMNFSPSVSLAYAVTKHMLVTASFNSLIHKQPYDGTKDIGYIGTGGYYSGSSVEAGVGYFHCFKKRYVIEAAAGYCNGSLSSHEFSALDYNYAGHSSEYYDYSVYYDRAFFNTAASFKSDYVQFSVGVRLTATNYHDFTVSNSYLTYIFEEDAPKSNSYLTTNTFFMLQPFIGIQVGPKHFNFNFQTGVNSQLGTRSLLGSYATPFYMTVGLGCDLQLLKSSI